MDFKVDDHSSDEENPVEDVDLDASKLNNFKTYSQNIVEACSIKKSYILHADLSTDARKLVVGLSTKEFQIYDVSSTGLTRNLAANDFGNFDFNVCGVKFFNEDVNMLLAGTVDGTVHLYDLRSYSRVHTFEDDSEGSNKTITCFDLNSNNRILCAGTDEIRGDVYQLFFEIRERKLMGGFYESHDEDVTSVSFHPTNPDLLATGSTDGLINIWDVQKESEDDALKYTLNTNSSVSRVKWHKKGNFDQLSCITHTQNLMLFDVDQQDLLKEWTRENVTAAIQRKSEADCYLIDSHNLSNDEMFVLATSNFNKGETIRTLKFNESNLKPFTNLQGNSQIIRTSLYHPAEDLIFTFGEGGIISIWKEGSAAETPNKNKSVSSVKKSLKKNKNPY